MGREVDTIASKGTNTIEKNNTTINIEDIAIFSSYEILEDGTRIFSAED